MGGNSNVELVKSDGKRLDGRALDELRPIKITAGVLERADGSAYVEWGNNKVYAAVYGPREVHPRHEQSATRAIVRCRYSMAPFSVDDRKRPGPDRRSQEISKVISEAFTGVVFTDQFPRTAIDVFMEVVEADAGTRCAAMTAASVALADAGIPMRDLVVAVASGKINGKVALDLNKPEDNFGEADCPMGIIPSTGEVVLLQMDGHLTFAEWEQALEFNMGAAKRIYELQKEALRERWARAAEAEGEPEMFVEPAREELQGFSGGGGRERGFGGGGGGGRGYGGGGRDRGRGGGFGGGRDRGRDRGYGGGGGGGRDRGYGGGGRDRGYGGGGGGGRDRGYGGGGSGRDRGYGGGRDRDRGYGGGGGGRDRGFGGGGRDRERRDDREGASEAPRDSPPPEGGERKEGEGDRGGASGEGGGGFERRDRRDRMDEFADRDRMSSAGRGRRRRTGSGGGGYRSGGGERSGDSNRDGGGDQ